MQPEAFSGHVLNPYPDSSAVVEDRELICRIPTIQQSLPSSTGAHALGKLVRASNKVSAALTCSCNYSYAIQARHNPHNIEAYTSEGMILRIVDVSQDPLHTLQ